MLLLKTKNKSFPLTVGMCLASLFLYFFSFLIISCNKKNTEASEFSDAFKPVFANTTHYFDFNQPARGMYYLDSAFAHIKNPNLNDRFRYFGFHYVYQQKTKGNYKLALAFADSMLATAQQSVSKQQYVSNFAEANYAKGDTYFSLNQYNDSYQCYFQGYLIAKSYLNKVSLSDYTYRMGMIMYKQAHYKQAAQYFKDSYAQNLSIPDNGKDDFPTFYRRQELLDNIAISYRHNGNLDSAVFYFDKALAFVNSNIDRFKNRADMLDMARGVIYGNKAEALIMSKQYDKAKGLLRKSIAINLKKGGDNRDAQSSEIKLAQIYYNQHKRDSLYKQLLSLRKQLDVLSNPDAEIDWNRLMGAYYLEKKDAVKALTYIQHYNVFKDSAIKRLSTLKESDVNQQLANFEKQYEIENLSNNNKLQKIYLSVAIISALMAIAIIFLVWRNWSRSKLDVITVKNLNKEINSQKKDLEKALDEIKNSSREKDRILRTVAHDLRNPLGGIASLTSIMVEETAYDTDLQYQLKIIKDTSSDTLELINEILEATNTTSTALKKQLVEVNSLLNNSIELLRFKASEKHQEIILDPLSSIEQLYINREMIWRVISNLISNAIKFSPVGETIRLKCINESTQVQISVTDHGIGIPDEMKDKVFNMFTDAKRAGTIGEKSFGLGLSICKQIIEKHQGKIWFESKAGKGTTFYISLPKPKKMDLIILESDREASKQKVN
ncbi:ATP-binding protein [Mucilaginibacter sp. BT774]|uniref:tetratricopeptide repeat-containing sensor histidine kinase n=1 Tax=Mucilaginibacter sp. BT774 TaxID=3062276 RepID=UPI00267642B9|nr:ATP-binding protein [Mucilaginibacter sp. BT774]MDO3625151.1 ATP-binding protein [Mucilaginibacter sp. BT774]